MAPFWELLSQFRVTNRLGVIMTGRIDDKSIRKLIKSLKGFYKNTRVTVLKPSLTAPDYSSPPICTSMTVFGHNFSMSFRFQLHVLVSRTFLPCSIECPWLCSRLYIPATDQGPSLRQERTLPPPARWNTACLARARLSKVAALPCPAPVLHGNGSTAQSPLQDWAIAIKLYSAAALQLFCYRYCNDLQQHPHILSQLEIVLCVQHNVSWSLIRLHSLLPQ